LTTLPGQSKITAIDISWYFRDPDFVFFPALSERKKFQQEWYVFIILTGISLGLTVSIKLTGLATIGIIGVILLAKIFSPKLLNGLARNQRFLLQFLPFLFLRRNQALLFSLPVIGKEDYLY